MSCFALSKLKTVILSLILVCVFLGPPCCVHRDRRPDPTVSGAPSPRFVFRFWKSFVLFLFVFLMMCGSSAAADSSPGPVDPVHTSRPGVPCLCLVVPSGTVLIIMSCLVRGDSLGVGGSSGCGHGGHFQLLASPCRWSGSGCWGTLWGPLNPGHAQRKPQHPSSALGGLPVPVGCPVLCV